MKEAYLLLQVQNNKKQTNENKKLIGEVIEFLNDELEKDPYCHWWCTFGPLMKYMLLSVQWSRRREEDFEFWQITNRQMYQCKSCIVEYYRQVQLVENDVRAGYTEVSANMFMNCVYHLEKVRFQDFFEQLESMAGMTPEMEVFLQLGFYEILSKLRHVQDDNIVQAIKAWLQNGPTKLARSLLFEEYCSDDEWQVGILELSLHPDPILGNWARLILQKPRKGSQDLRNLIDGTEDKIVGTWIGSLDAYMYSTPGHQRHSEISIWKSFSLFVEKSDDATINSLVQTYYQVVKLTLSSIFKAEEGLKSNEFVQPLATCLARFLSVLSNRVWRLADTSPQTVLLAICYLGRTNCMDDSILTAINGVFVPFLRSTQPNLSGESESEQQKLNIRVQDDVEFIIVYLQSVQESYMELLTCANTLLEVLRYAFRPIPRNMAPIWPTNSEEYWSQVLLNHAIDVANKDSPTYILAGEAVLMILSSYGEYYRRIAGHKTPEESKVTQQHYRPPALFLKLTSVPCSKISVDINTAIFTLTKNICFIHSHANLLEMPATQPNYCQRTMQVVTDMLFAYFVEYKKHLNQKNTEQPKYGEITGPFANTFLPIVLAARFGMEEFCNLYIDDEPLFDENNRYEGPTVHMCADGAVDGLHYASYSLHAVGFNNVLDSWLPYFSYFHRVVGIVPDELIEQTFTSNCSPGDPTYESRSKSIPELFWSFCRHIWREGFKKARYRNEYLQVIHEMWACFDSQWQDWCNEEGAIQKFMFSILESSDEWVDEVIEFALSNKGGVTACVNTIDILQLICKSQFDHHIYVPDGARMVSGMHRLHILYDADNRLDFAVQTLHNTFTFVRSYVPDVPEAGQEVFYIKQEKINGTAAGPPQPVVIPSQTPPASQPVEIPTISNPDPEAEFGLNEAKCQTHPPIVSVSDFLAEVLHMCKSGFQIGNNVALSVPPLDFKDGNVYKDSFEPLLLEETRAQLLQQRDQNTNTLNSNGGLRLSIKALENSQNSLLKYSCFIDRVKDAQAYETIDTNDVMYLSPTSENTTSKVEKNGFYAIARSANTADLYCNIYIFVLPNSFSEESMDKPFDAVLVGSLTSSIREFEALRSIDMMPRNIQDCLLHPSQSIQATLKKSIGRIQQLIESNPEPEEAMVVTELKKLGNLPVTGPDFMHVANAISTISKLKSDSRASIKQLSTSIAMKWNTIQKKEGDCPLCTPPEQWNTLKTIHDASQLSAIKVVVNSLTIRSSRSEAITLLQGPPGTGKTRTLLGILSALLATRVPIRSTSELQNRDPKPEILPPTNSNTTTKPSFLRNPKRKIEALSSSSSNESKHAAKSVKEEPRILSQKEKTMIARNFLVCAPSNGAIDEVISRLIAKNSLVDKRGIPFTPSVIRLGLADETTSKDVQKTLLSNIVEKHFENHELTKRIDVLAKQVKKLQNEKLESNVAINNRSKAIAELRKYRQILYRLQNDYAISRLNAATIVCSTLSSAGGGLLEQMNHGFDCLLIDEAAQSVETSTLIAIRQRCARVVLIGDPMQLPATVISEKANSFKFDRSLFERLEASGNTKIMLTIQYRMHPIIRNFPSNYFYDGLLTDAPSKQCHEPEQLELYETFPFLEPFVFFNLKHGTEDYNSGTNNYVSKSNQHEILVIKEMIKHVFDQSSRWRVWANRIGIVTPYKKQRDALREAFAKEFGNYHGVDINTVDGFQGQEKDIIVFSCVRSSKSRNGGIGFLKDRRRLNVAITRAKYSLIVVGSASTLQQNGLWNNLIKSAANRGCLAVLNSSSRSFEDDMKNTFESYPFYDLRKLRLEMNLPVSATTSKAMTIATPAIKTQDPSPQASASTNPRVAPASKMPDTAGRRIIVCPMTNHSRSNRENRDKIKHEKKRAKLTKQAENSTRNTNVLAKVLQSNNVERNAW